MHLLIRMGHMLNYSASLVIMTVEVLLAYAWASFEEELFIRFLAESEVAHIPLPFRILMAYFLMVEWVSFDL